MILYFTATGNSLYAAKQLDDELLSIPQEMHRKNRHYKADRIGIVCPLFEFEMPPMVKDFIRGSEFETDYFYVVVTYGMHHGGVAVRTDEFLKSCGIDAGYINTLIMHDNALIVFDMDQQRTLEAGKQVDEHIAQIKADIDAKRTMIQEPEQGEIDFYNGYIEHKKKAGPMYSFPLYRIEDSCISCGTCTKVCPRGCVRLVNGKPVYDYTGCINCMACIQACPVKAIRFASVKEPNPASRYRNVHISLAEIIRANKQDLPEAE
ncbi:MAG: EFR1 family ferrodoxin [Solobacterium sp.]|nr:EFR1 family ferrodoxin [Solobacterium sp.]